ncbi:MAG: helix-turn-helix domain-containing protein [Muribaculaceae bacterium]|nr:helix-turn-helix domain-containing protein [Muribaculaceae bacterium]
MQNFSTNRSSVHHEFGTLSAKDNFDGQIFVFSDMKDLALPGEPFKVPMPIFAVCTEGVAFACINLNNYNLRPGDMISLLPDHIIQNYNVSSDFKGMFVGVTYEYIEKVSVDVHTLLPYVLDFKSSPKISLDSREVMSLKVMFDELSRIIRDKSGYYDKNIIYHLLHAMLYSLLNIYHRRNRFSSMRRSRSEIIFHSFVHHLEHNFKVNRSVTYYADLLCISSKHLSVVTKELTGKTAGEVIDDYVMMAAKTLLSSSSKTIKEISTELNFPNPSFFGKYFHKHAGVSPNKYRVLINSNPNFDQE